MTVEIARTFLSLFLAKNKQNKTKNTYNCNVTYTVKRPVMFIEKEKKTGKKSVNTY